MSASGRRGGGSGGAAASTILEYLTQEDEARFATLRGTAPALRAGAELEAAADRRLVVTSRTVLTPEQDAVVGERADPQAFSAAQVVPVAVDIQHFPRALHEGLTAATLGQLGALLDYWAVLLSQRTSMFASAIRLPYCFEYTAGGTPAALAKLQSLVRLHALDLFTYDKVLSALLINNNKTLALVELALDRMSPLGYPCVLRTYVIGVEPKRMAVDVNTLLSLNEELRAHALAIVRAFANGGSASAQHLQARGPDGMLKQLEVDGAFVLAEEQDITHPPYMGIFATETVEERVALFLKTWQWLSEQHELSGIADRFELGVNVERPLRGMNREINVALQQQTAMTTAASQRFSPYPTNAEERMMRRVAHPQVLSQALISEYMRAAKYIQVGSGEVVEQQKNARQPGEVLQNAENFCIGRLMGGMNVYSATPAALAEQLFGMKPTDPRVGSFAPQPTPRTWNTVADLMLLHVAHFPMLCPLPPPHVDLLTAQHVVVAIGRAMNTRGGAALMTAIVTGARSLYDYVAGLWPQTIEGRQGRVHLVFDAILLYLDMCKVYDANPSDARALKFDADHHLNRLRAENQRFFEVSEFIAAVAGAKLQKRGVGDMIELLKQFTKPDTAITLPGATHRDEAMERYQTTAMSWLSNAARMLTTSSGKTTSTPQSRWTDYIGGARTARQPTCYTKAKAVASADTIQRLFDMKVGDFQRDLWSDLFATLQAQAVDAARSNRNDGACVPMVYVLPQTEEMLALGVFNPIMNIEHMDRVALYERARAHFPEESPIAAASSSTTQAASSPARPPPGSTARPKQSLRRQDGTTKDELSALDELTTGVEANGSAANNGKTSDPFKNFGATESEQAQIIGELFSAQSIAQVLSAGTPPKARHHFAQLRQLLADNRLQLDVAGYGALFLLGEILERVGTGQQQAQLYYGALLPDDDEQIEGNVMRAAQDTLVQLLRALEDDVSRSTTRAQSLARLVGDVGRLGAANNEEAQQDFRTALMRWMDTLLTHSFDAQDRIHLAIAAALHRLVTAFFGNAEEPNRFAEMGGLARFQVVEVLIAQFFESRVVEDEALVSIRGQLSKLRSVAANLLTVLHPLLSDPQTPVQQYSAYNIQLLYRDFFNAMFDMALSTQYFVVLNSALIQRLTVSRANISAVAAAGRNEAWLSDLLRRFGQALRLRSADDGTLLEVTQSDIAAATGAEPLIQRIHMIYDRTGSFGTKDFDRLCSQALLDGHIQALLEHTGIVLAPPPSGFDIKTTPAPIDWNNASRQLEARAERSLRATHQFDLTDAERRSPLTAALASVTNTVLSTLMLRKQPLTGLQTERQVTGHLHRIVSQRVMFAERLLYEFGEYARITTTKVTPPPSVNLYTSTFYTLLWDEQRQRVFWTALGEASPLMVSYKVPDADRREAALRQLYRSTQALRLTHGEAARQSGVIARNIAAVERDQNTALLFVAEGGYSATLQRLADELIGVNSRMAEKERLPDGTKTASYVALQAEQSRLNAALAFFRTIRTLNALEPNERRASFANLLHATPVFAALMLRWNTSFAALAAFLPSVQRQLSSWLSAASFANLVTRVRHLSDSFRGGVVPTNALQLIGSAITQIMGSGAASLSGVPVPSTQQAAVELLASRLSFQGIPLQNFLDDQTATSANVLAQLEYWLAVPGTAIPDHEAQLVQEFALWIRDPYVTGAALPPEFNAVTRALNMRHERALAALIRKINDTVAEADPPHFFVVRGDVKMSQRPQFIRDAADSNNLLALTVVLLRQIANDTSTTGVVLPVFTGAVSTTTTIGAGPAQALRRRVAAATTTPPLPLASGTTAAATAGAGKALITVASLTAEGARVLLASYTTSPSAFKTRELNAFQLVEVTDRQLAVVTQQDQQAVRAASRRIHELLVIGVSAQHFRIVELNAVGTDTLVSTLKTISEDTRKMTERWNREMLIGVEVSTLDATTEPLDEEMYHRWRVESSATNNSWLSMTPLQDAFALGSQLVQREINTQQASLSKREASQREAAAEQLQADRGFLSRCYTPRVLTASHLHTVGAGWLKNVKQIASQQQCFDMLRAAGAPVSWAHTMSTQYAAYWSKPGAIPLLEPSPLESARAGVLHLDARVSALVIRSTRFMEAERVDPTIVQNVFEANALDYYMRKRLTVLLDALQEAHALAPERSGWVPRFLSRMPGVSAPNLGELKAFSTYLQLMYKQLFAYDPLIAVANAQSSTEAFARTLSYKQVLALLIELVKSMQVFLKPFSAEQDRLQDEVELERELKKTAEEVLERRDRLVMFNQVAPNPKRGQPDEPTVATSRFTTAEQKRLERVDVRVIRFTTDAANIIDLAVVKQQMRDVLVSLNLMLELAFSEELQRGPKEEGEGDAPSDKDEMERMLQDISRTTDPQDTQPFDPREAEDFFRQFYPARMSMFGAVASELRRFRTPKNSTLVPTTSSEQDQWE